MKLRNLALGGMVAALYAALTVLLAPLSYGPVQLRFSEGLTLLPYFLPEAVPGLAVGCLIANLFGGYGAVDVVVGTGATLLAAVLTRRMLRPLTGAFVFKWGLLYCSMTSFPLRPLTGAFVFKLSP